MKKVIWVFAALLLIVGCSNHKELTGDLTGSWYIYKITRDNVDQTHLVGDSFQHYNITFTSDGKYVEQNSYSIDTLFNTGTWAFQNNYGQLALTDTANKTTTYTILNLVGNHVELLKDREDRYMRKNQ